MNHEQQCSSRDDSGHELGSRVVEGLVHVGQVDMLMKPQLMTALKFKSVSLPSQSKKSELVQLLRRKMSIMSSD